MSFITALKNRVVRILRWSEQYTKTDMVFLSSGGSLSFISQGISILASLGLAIVIGHVVPQVVYGEYKYVLSVVTILTFFSLSGIGNAVTQSVARGFDGTMQKAFWINLRWSILIFFGALGVALYYFAYGNSQLAIGILIGGFLSPILGSANLYGSFLVGKKDFVRQITYAMIENTIPILLFICVVLVTTNPIALVATYFLGNVVATLYFYGRTIQVYHPNPNATDAGMLSYGKHLSAMGILGGIADNLDQVLLFHFVGAAQLAIYNFAIAIPDQIKGPIKTIDAMLLANFTRRGVKEIRSSMWNKFLWLLLFTGVATIAYLILVPYVFELLFPKYIAAISYTRIYALWMMSTAFDPTYIYLLAKKKVREQYVLNIGSSLFLLVSITLGAVWWGMLGVILARLASKWVFVAIEYVLYEYAVRKDEAAIEMQPTSTV